VAFSKRVAIIRDNPKIVALVLSLLLSTVSTYAQQKGGAWAIAEQAIILLGFAVGTHEILLKPFLKKKLDRP
jgi:hypothetical protein